MQNRSQLVHVRSSTVSSLEVLQHRDVIGEIAKPFLKFFDVTFGLVIDQCSFVHVCFSAYALMRSFDASI
jgi:hypothetical protein